MATFDLTVRGAGIFGLTVAWAAVKKGARVRVIDPRGVGGGSSGGVVGALAPHAPERWNDTKAFQLECLLAAPGFWQEIEVASGQSSGFRASGRIQPLANDRAVTLAKERALSARDLWRGQASWSVTGDCGTWAPPSPTGLWVHDTLSSQIDPARALPALAAAVAGAGAEIAPDGAEVGAVIHATGWEGLLELSANLGVEVGSGEKGQAAVLRADPGLVPQIYAENLHIVAHGPGRVAIGSTSERPFVEADKTDEKLDDLIARATSVMPDLRDAPVVQRWAGVRPRARSRAPILGPWPDRPGHFVANGGFKIGFAVAPGLAPLVVDLALSGADAIPDQFRLQRLTD